MWLKNNGRVLKIMLVTTILLIALIAVFSTYQDNRKYVVVSRILGSDRVYLGMWVSELKSKIGKLEPDDWPVVESYYQYVTDSIFALSISYHFDGITFFSQLDEIGIKPTDRFKATAFDNQYLKQQIDNIEKILYQQIHNKPLRLEEKYTYDFTVYGRRQDSSVIKYWTHNDLYYILDVTYSITKENNNQDSVDKINTFALLITAVFPHNLYKFTQQ